MLQNFVRQHISRQFGKPSGLLGRMLERGMSKRTAGDAEWTVSLLGIQPNSRILEIGFGGGVSTQLANRQASQGSVAGIDHSATMVQVTRKRNADAIRAGRMELNYGDAASIPYPDDSFDIAFSLHSIYFWNDPLECLRGFRRVLNPGGLLAITIQPRTVGRKTGWKRRGCTCSSEIRLPSCSHPPVSRTCGRHRSKRTEK